MRDPVTSPSQRTLRALEQKPVRSFSWNGFALALIAATALLALVLLSGCVASEDRDLLTTAAGVAGGTIGDWGSLTDEQRLRSCYKLTRALYVLDANLNGHAIPPVFLPLEPSREILVKAQR